VSRGEYVALSSVAVYRRCPATVPAFGARVREGVTMAIDDAELPVI